MANAKFILFYVIFKISELYSSVCYIKRNNPIFIAIYGMSTKTKICSRLILFLFTILIYLFTLLPQYSQFLMFQLIESPFDIETNFLIFSKDSLCSSIELLFQCNEEVQVCDTISLFVEWCIDFIDSFIKFHYYFYVTSHVLVMTL